MQNRLDTVTYQLKALINVFDSNQCISEVETYIEQIKVLLSQRKFDKILFCLKEICRAYDIDIYSNNDDKTLANIKAITVNLEEILKEIASEDFQNDKFKKFWTLFITWFNDIQETDNIIKAEFYYWEDSFDSKKKLYIDYDKLYKLQYGIPYEDIKINICFDNIKNFIEMIYKNVLIPTDGRLKFTIKINEILRNFSLSYKLEKGKFTSIGYKTSENIDYILNYEQFERKIRYSEEMIVHKYIMDKHNALNYVSDAFCYFFSLFKKTKDDELIDDKVINKLANMVCLDTNSKIYSLIKEEIKFVKMTINNDFDIRHNEYYKTTEKCKRESLTNIKTIEYLYNRIYALLFLLRLNYKPQTLGLINEDF